MLAGGALLCTAPLGAADKVPVKSHALSLDDRPKYGADFKHLDYVNPDAPKGGEIRINAQEGFDSLNPWILAGRAPEGIAPPAEAMSDYCFDLRRT